MHFNFLTSGESHGKALLTIVEGMPAGVAVDVQVINRDLWRRQQGYGRGGRMRIESDEAVILSGVRHGKTTGSPISLMIRNTDYENWLDVMSIEPREFPDEKMARKVSRPRPGHADLAGGLKYNIHDLRDILERASARETAARVAAGGLARMLLSEFGIQACSHTVMLGGVPEIPIEASWDQIAAIPDNSLLRCIDPDIEKQMVDLIDMATHNKDTLGGVFEVIARGVIPGLGSHAQWNSRLDGRLAGAIMSIPSVKAVEIGSGIEGAGKPGSIIHDEIGYNESERVFTRSSNRAGGLEGGITNGEELRIRGFMKPISTLRRPLASVDVITKAVSEAAFERSDIVAVPAGGVIGEAMAAIVLADAIREKFGGDSLEEMKTNFNNYKAQIRNY